MCQFEGVNLQRGMNFHLKGGLSVILMSRRPGAPYNDAIQDEGRTLIYEGHDAPKSNDIMYPKLVDQPRLTPNGKLTQNGLFYRAAKKHRSNKNDCELVKVYEKLYPSVWVFNGLFYLVDSWIEESDKRKVFKFKLELTDLESSTSKTNFKTIEHTRIIPSAIKQEVWKRDEGKCIICGSKDNLHFDHIIPYSKGGSSLVAKNIQLLCARHNIAKKDKIE
jgi:hypothetical protein